MNHYVIGSYQNEQNQIYCTVIALCNDLTEAIQIQEKLNVSPLFLKDSITKESKEMVDQLSVDADLWNQIDIVQLSDVK